MPDADLIPTEDGWQMCPRCMVPLTPTENCDRCGAPVAFDPANGDTLIYGPPHYEEVASYRHGSCCGINDCPACGGSVSLSEDHVTVLSAKDDRIIKALVHQACERYVTP